jgi:hypothetical protein
MEAVGEQPHRRERRLIDRHFRADSTPAREQEMRAHLEDCAACRAYYDRHLMLAGIDPAAPAAEARLAAGLGLPAPRRRFALFPALTVAAAGVAALLLLVPGLRGGEFRTRGVAGQPSSPALSHSVPSLHIVRVLGPDQFAPVEQEIRADEHLAFAHVNPGDFDRLLIVAVDEHGHRFWYHPDVTHGRESIAIAEDGGTRTELGEAIRHDLDGRQLRIMGLFSRQPLTVEVVDGLVDASGCAGLQPRLPEAMCVETKVDVRQE